MTGAEALATNMHSNQFQLYGRLSDNRWILHSGGLPASESVPFRVYVRWPNQRVSDKTTTASEAAAELVFDDLVKRWDLADKGALGVAMTVDGSQRKYYSFETGELTGWSG